MKVGDTCTVKHHYGHTDTEKVMTITEIFNASGLKSGIGVKVDGLELAVDSGLIVVIPEKTVELNINQLAKIIVMGYAVISEWQYLKMKHDLNFLGHIQTPDHGTLIEFAKKRDLKKLYSSININIK